MLCCSEKCKKKYECGLYYHNHFGEPDIVEDIASCGSGSISTEGITENWWCGELGDYKMFRPIQFSEREFEIFHCTVCGFQKCTGVNSEWFNDCKFKDHLIKY